MASKRQIDVFFQFTDQTVRFDVYFAAFKVESIRNG